MWNLFRRLVGMESNEHLEYLSTLADAANGHVPSQNDVGFMYADGWPEAGVTQDDVEAVSWWRSAADHGLPDAQVNLGFMYDNGRGVRKSYSKAVSWFRKAADQGHAKAQFNLGFAYANGRGVSRNYAKAASWFRKAGDNEYGKYVRANAKSHLGFMYAHGRGVRKNYAKAAELAKLYRLALTVGHSYACHVRGLKNQEEDVEAHKWFNVYASIYGEESEHPTFGKESAKKRDDKAESMTPQAVADAQQRATDWLTAFEQSGEKAGGVAYFKKTVTDGPMLFREEWYEERYPK